MDAVTIEDCIHGLTLETCTICNGRDDASGGTRRRETGSAQKLDTPGAVERYRSYYSGDREATFDAYVEVFFGVEEASTFPGGWTKFSRCANAEPALAEHEPELVASAERIMRVQGYEADEDRCLDKVR